MGNNGIKIYKPIAVSDDIVRVIGDSTDVGRSSNVNIWSKNKPFETWNPNPHEEQSDDDRREAAYGFYWWNRSTESSAPFATSANDLLDKAMSNGAAWVWRKPSITRMGDFANYNHNAKKPYYFSVSTPDLGKNNYILCSHDPYDSNVEIKMSNMPDFIGEWTGSVSDLNVVVIYRKRGFSTTHQVFTGSKVSDLDSGNNLRLHVNLTSLGTYDAVIAATNLSSDNQSEDDYGNSPVYVYLPESIVEMIFREGLTWDWGEYFNGESYVGFFVEGNSGDAVSGRYDEARYTYLNFAVKNDFDYDIDWMLQVKMWNTAEGQTIDDATTVAMLSSADGGGVISKNTTEYLEEIIVDMVDVGGYTTLGNVKVAVDFQYKYTINSGWLSRHFVLTDRTVGDGYSSDGYTLYDIAYNTPNYGQVI